MGKQGPCNHCGVAVTPLWRNGPPEKPVLCNACGSRWRTRGTLVNYMPLHAGGLGLSSAAATKWRLKNPGARQPPGAANGKRMDGGEDGGAEAQKDAEAWLAKKGSGGAAQGGGARMGRGLRGRGPGVKRKVWQRGHGGVRGGERSGSVGGCGVEVQSGAGLGSRASERWDEEMELDMVWGDEDDEEEKGSERSGAANSSGGRKDGPDGGGSEGEGSEEVIRMDDDGSVETSHRLQGVPIPPKRRSLGGGGQRSASPYGAGSSSGMRPRSQSEADLTALRLRHCAGGGGGKEGTWRENGVRARGGKGAKREGDMDLDVGGQWNEGEEDCRVDRRARHNESGRKMGAGRGGGGEKAMREEEVWVEEGGDDELGGGEEGVVAVDDDEEKTGEEGEEEEEEGDEDVRLELLQHVPSGQRELVLLTMPSPHYRTATAPSAATGAAGAGAVVGKGRREQAVGGARADRVGMQRVASDGSIRGGGGRMGGMPRAGVGEGAVGKSGMTGARQQGTGMGGGGTGHAAIASSAEVAGAMTDDFLLHSPHSRLCSVNLTDIVNASSLYRRMDHAHKCQLVAMLPTVDTANGSASVESMFRSKAFLGAVRNFQKLLAQGMFDSDALPADTAQLFASLTSTSCLDLSASGWWQRWSQAHASTATIPHPPVPPHAVAAAAAAATLVAPMATDAAAASATAFPAPSTVPPAPVTAAVASAPTNAASPDTRATATLPASPILSAVPSNSSKPRVAPAHGYMASGPGMRATTPVPVAISGRGSTAAPTAAALAAAAGTAQAAAAPTGAASAAPVTASGAGGETGGQVTSLPSPAMSAVSSAPPDARPALNRCTAATATATGHAAGSSMGSGVMAVDVPGRRVGGEVGIGGGKSGFQGGKKPPLGAEAAAAGMGAGHKGQRVPAAAAASAPCASAPAGPFPAAARSTGMAAGKTAVIPVEQQQQQQQQARGTGAPAVGAGIGVVPGKLAEANDEDDDDGSFAAVCGHVKVPQQPRHKNQVARDPSQFALSPNFFSGSSLLSASPPTAATTPSPPPFYPTFATSRNNHPSTSAYPTPLPRINPPSSSSPVVASPSSHGPNTWQKLAAAAAARPAASSAAAAAATPVSGKGGIAAIIGSRRPIGASPGGTSAGAVVATCAPGASDVGSRYTLGEGVLNGRLIVARSVDMFSDPLRDNLMWDSSCDTGGSSRVIVPHGATAMQEPLE
ncbi:hypothetical protein CLOM_g17333 [Closterium sp. NIES-68]|nr:hypothetical protein CLOM_g17333 [Closterium sp. NIES-68]GJP73155.1 hypothetical protein CLOP_g3893 [Closterium sp. NIES-67]